MQIIKFVGAGCWGTPTIAGHTRTDTNVKGLTNQLIYLFWPRIQSK